LLDYYSACHAAHATLEVYFVVPELNELTTWFYFQHFVSCPTSVSAQR
jgi:hypothetical protein